MDRIKKFNEMLQNPSYARGKVLVFTRGDSDIDDSFVKKICVKLGYEFGGQYGQSRDSFIIKTPMGKENQAGNDFKENYPEFFSGFERLDLREILFTNTIEEVRSDVQDLFDNYMGYTDKRRFINKEELDKDIDEIIKKLNILKID